MLSSYWKVRLACGLSLLTLAGCYSNYPYGAGSYPRSYPQPAGGYPPAGNFQPNNVGPGGAPQAAPQTFSQPPTAEGNWQGTQSSRPIGGAQFFDPGASNEVVVPDPGANTIVPPANDFSFEK